MKRKFLASLLALCGLTAFAVEPVAVWNGDLADGDTKGVSNAFVMSKSGSDSVVTFEGGVAKVTQTSSSATQGVRVDWPTATDTINAGKLTVFVKYSGLSYGNQNHALISLVTPSEGNEVVAYVGSNKTKIGLAHGATSTGGGNQGYGTPNVSLPEEGIMMLSIAHENFGAATDLCGTRFAYAAKQTDGTYGNFTEGNYNSGIKWSSQKFYGVKVGGSVAPVGSYYRPTMTIEGIAIYNQATSLTDAASMTSEMFPDPEPEGPKVEPILLVNVRPTSSSAVEGWSDIVGNDVAQLSCDGFATSGSSGRFWDKGVSGASLSEEVIAEIKTSLGLADTVVFDSSVINTGSQNGAQNGHTATISNLDASAMYIVYVGMGVNDNSGHTGGFKINAGSDYTSATSIESITAGQTEYSQVANNTAVNVANNSLLVVRMTEISPTSAGQIKFTLTASHSTLNFVAVSKLNVVKPTSKTFDISGTVTYDTLETDGLTKVTLNLTADATVTFNEAVSAALTFTGAHNLTVKGAEKLNFDSVNAAGVTGDKTFEFDASGYTAGTNLKNLIKAGGDKYTFVFKGTGNAGVTVDYGDTNITANGPIFTSHVVFDGGTHTLKERHENQSANFGSNATAAKPTFLVRNGATLTYQARNPSGWGPGAANANGIIRVNDGCTLNLQQIQGTLYWNQQFYIEPGATLNHTEGAGVGSNQYNIRMLGGAIQNACQIYVPASDTVSDKVATFSTTRGIEAKSEGNNKGLGIFVGANSKLKISGPISGSEQIRKYGEGTLAIGGTVSAINFAVEAGALAGGTYSAGLTLSTGASLDLSATATVSGGTLTLPNQVNLVCTPVHGMTVITPPSGFAGEDYTATLNGAANAYDLYLDGGTLKLKYKTPPAFPEGFGDFVIEVANGKVGEISVDVSKLSLNDYEKDSGVSYKLDFGGDKIVVGARTDNTVTFNLATGDFLTEHVYRGDFVVEFTDGEVKKPITVYEGVRTPTWISSELIIRKRGTINDAQGETIKLEEEESILNHDPDYIDNCDSVYMVTLSASEAVDADTESVGDSQGGLRLVKVDESTVKLEYLFNDENDNNTVKWGDQWPDGTKTGTVTLALNASVAVRVEFHYAKGEDGDTSYVKYSIGEDYVKSVTSWAAAKKVTEVFIADGTVLPDDLTGLFQLDSAVVVDIELKPGEGDAIDYDSEEKANAALKTLKVGICDAVKAVLTTTEAQNEYRSYFHLVVVPSTTLQGGYSVITDFTSEAKSEIEKEIEDALAQVVDGFNIGSAEIAAKPGLYYGVKRGDTLGNMNTVETELATSDKVTIKITKPEGASAHFYRIIVSPTPETK